MSAFQQALLDLHDELICDNFAGGGGASTAIEQATGRMVDIAINHDAAALAMHQANHPQTLHIQTDIFDVDPREVTGGRKVGFAWFSPDCTFHSKARGAKPIRSKTKKRRSLAWVVKKWAGTVRPRVIALENVEEFADWGPLIGPVDELKPCPKRRGQTFRKWVRDLEHLGYVVEWRELRACDYGAPTIRKRLFLIARCDGKPVVWPVPSHGDPKSEAVKSGKLKPWRTAAECIDWTIPMLSIFATKEEARAWGKAHGQAAPIRPLAENTHRRIARGVGRYVLENPNPYFVSVAHSDCSPSGVKRWGKGEYSLDDPFGTVTNSHDRGVVAPILSPVTHVNSDRRATEMNEPIPTVTCAHRGEFSLIAPSITKFRTGSVGAEMDEPLSTVTANSYEKKPGGATPLGIMAGVLVPRYGERPGQAPRARSIQEPAPVIVPGGNGASLVAPSISTYYGSKSDADARGNVIDEPLRVQGTENRHAVSVGLLMQNNEGFYKGDGRSLEQPAPCVCSNGSTQSLVAAHVTHANTGHTPNSAADAPAHTIVSEGAAHAVVGTALTKLRGTSTDADPSDPLDTISAGGTHHGVCAAHIQRDFGNSVGSKANEPVGTITSGCGGHAALVASFMSEYYGTGTGFDLREPSHTIPTVDRFGLVTVTVTKRRSIPTSWGEMVILEKGTYVLSDICMRMLQPKELYAAQGFPKGYIIDQGVNGKPLTKTEQVRMVGNSVSPPPAIALIRANCPELIARPEIRKKMEAVA